MAAGTKKAGMANPTRIIGVAQVPVGTPDLSLQCCAGLGLVPLKIVRAPVGTSFPLARVLDVE